MKTPPKSQDDKSEKNTDAIRSAIVDKLIQSDQSLAIDKQGAWEVFRQLTSGKTRGATRRLTINESITLAKRMHVILGELGPALKAKGFSKKDICVKAFGRAKDSRELHRLTLSPGMEEDNRGLRRTGSRYRELLDALAAMTGRTKQDLAYRLVEGTSLHPLGRSPSEIGRLELIATGLEDLVRRLSIEFGWRELYEETARLKAGATEQAEDNCWPLWDVDLWWDLEDPDGKEKAEQELRVAGDINQAYYRPKTNSYVGEGHLNQALSYFDTGHLQDSKFLFVPHAAIGHMLLWDLPDPRDLAGYKLERERQLRGVRSRGTQLLLPEDRWNEDKRCPEGQTDGNDLQYHFWLVAYPGPLDAYGNVNVVPCLYQPAEEGGAFLAPLNMTTLTWLQQAVWVDADRDAPFLDRLQSLLMDVDSDGMCSLERQLRRTGSWLQFNPVLKKRDKARSEHEALFQALASRHGKPLPKRD